jgi:DNA-binding NtrC family response regulator
MKRPNLLIIEDDDLMQSMLRDMLAGQDFDAVYASDGLEGWNTLENTDVDLVLADLMLPKMDGLTLLKKVKDAYPELLVVIMTAYGTIQSAVEAMKFGAYDYITKPFLAEELILLIRKCLEFDRLRDENRRLRRELDRRFSLDTLVGKSKAMQEVYRLIETVASSASTVLIQGESGTGKERVAEALHRLSLRKDKPLVKVSCAALPVTLLESELFGHEKGAFTDAVRRKIGRFELAHQGTLFLDDIDDIDLAVQKKLLRVLQEKEFERVGGSETIKVDVRVVAATKVDLRKAVQEARFREDLFYRLNVVPICLPPLVERKEDIPLLVDHFLKRFNTLLNKSASISPRAIEVLVNYRWPGNIRELENMVERLVNVVINEQISPQDLPDTLLNRSEWTPSELKNAVRSAEREHIEKTLAFTAGKKKEAAKILGITPKNLWEKLKLYKIE